MLALRLHRAPLGVTTMRATRVAGKVAFLSVAGALLVAAARPADAGGWHGRAFFSVGVAAPGFALSVGNGAPYPYRPGPYAPYACGPYAAYPAPAVSYVQVYVPAPYPHMIWRPVYARGWHGSGWQRGWARDRGWHRGWERGRRWDGDRRWGR